MLLVGATALALNACAEDPVHLYPACVRDIILPFDHEDPSEYVAPECTIEDAMASRIEGTDFQHPPEYLDELTKIFSFVHDDFSRSRENLSGLEEVIFYSPVQDSCQEEYGGVLLRITRVSGFTNVVNLLFLNDLFDRINLENDDQVERKAYFGYVIGGQHHVFVHELGHIELEEYFLTASKARIDEITPQNDPCYATKQHYLVERYAHFVQMAYARAHPEEFTENNLFAQNIFPYLERLAEENPELLEEEISQYRQLIDHLDDVLQQGFQRHRKYHDLQYDFFKDDARVISPDFPYDLSFAAMQPFLENLVAQQQEKAYQKLDELETR